MGQASTPKKYRGKKSRNRPSLEHKSITDFQGGYNDLGGYIFDLGTREFKYFPKQWRNCSNTLYQYTVTSNTQTSWLIPQPPSPTQILLPSLIWSLRAQKLIHRWLTFGKGTSMKPPTKIWELRNLTKYSVVLLLVYYMVLYIHLVSRNNERMGCCSELF